ncbi:MAG: general stress protein, partial [Minisyncoccia bacterium]
MAQNTRRNRRKSGRGFAGMDPDRQRQIAAMGGRSQGQRNNPGNFANNPERAAAAGRKG